MKGYSSREIIQIIRADGWVEVNHEGSHKQFKHSTKPGRVTIPHLQKDLPIKTVKSICQQAGVPFEEESR